MTEATPLLTTRFLLEYYNEHPEPNKDGWMVVEMLAAHLGRMIALDTDGPWCRHQLWDAGVFT